MMVIFILSLSPSNAQLERGSVLIGLTSTMNLWGDYGSDLLSIGFSTNKYNGSDPYKCTSFSLIPRGGYFIMDNLAAGVDIALSFWSEKSTHSDYKESSMGIVAGPFVRYYYPLEKVYPFAELNFGIGTEKYGYKSGSYESEDSNSIMLFGFGLGAAIPLGEKVTFDTTIGYTNVTWKGKDEEADEKNTSGTIGLKMGFSIFFGPK
ncbi:MAG: outer membrane beta-barrel protein [Bacteroidales bacterium]|nr:outer membrane beta-barrel protein [Bacteroidales bacterium]